MKEIHEASKRKFRSWKIQISLILLYCFLKLKYQRITRVGITPFHRIGEKYISKWNERKSVLDCVACIGLWRLFLNIKKHLSNCLILEQTNDLDRERGGESWRGSLLEMQRGRRGWELSFVPSYPRSLSRR